MATMNDTTRKTHVGQRVRDLRESLGVGLRQMCRDLAHVRGLGDPTRVGKKELGEAEFTVSQLAAVAEYLRAEPGFFYVQVGTSQPGG